MSSSRTLAYEAYVAPRSVLSHPLPPVWGLVWFVAPPPLTNLPSRTRPLGLKPWYTR